MSEGMATSYPTGPCCLSENCQYPTQQLRREHTCPWCNRICHILCGKFDTALDKYVCLSCLSEQPLCENEVAAALQTLASITPRVSVASALTTCTNVASARNMGNNNPISTKKIGVKI